MKIKKQKPMTIEEPQNFIGISLILLKRRGTRSLEHRLKIKLLERSRNEKEMLL